MKAFLLSATIILSSLSAIAGDSISTNPKIFGCLAWYRDTLSISIASPADISVFNQFYDQVKYSPSPWLKLETEETSDFTLTNSLSAVAKAWNNVEQKWEYTDLPKTTITVEFTNGEPTKVKSSFMNLNCNQQH